MNHLSTKASARRVLFACGIALLVAGCLGGGSGGGSGSGGSFPSSGSSPYSASTNSAPSGFTVPSRDAVSAGIVVRPDLLCVSFALRTMDPDADAGVARLQAASTELTNKIKAAFGPAAVSRMRGVAIAPSAKTYDKTTSDAPTPFGLVVDGIFEIPLGEGLDYWARSALVARLAKLTHAEEEARAKTVLEITFEPPNLKVKDPEVHRGKLTEQWVKRARAFADAAQSPGAPLLLLDCAPPGEITQRAVSTEEVSLTLAVSCRLDTSPK